MSGSSGTGGAVDPPVLNCGTISFTTDLNSPQEQAIEGLMVGDKLPVEVDEGRVVVKRNGKILGSINWSSISKLIECIESGYTYVAVIRDIKGGFVKILVKPD